MPPITSRRSAPLIGALLLRAQLAHAHDDTTPPQPLAQPAPAWPGGHAHDHDLVVPMVVQVDEQGAVIDAAVEASLGPALDDAALVAVRRWRFRPALRAGAPVRAKIRVVVRFLGAGNLATAAPSVAAAPRQVGPAPRVAPAPGRPSSSPAARGDRDELVVEGQQREGDPRSASERSVNRPVLEAAPHHTAGDLLLTVPGVSVSQHGGEGKAYQIFFRGFDAVHGQDLEIWAGGAPVNDVSNVHGQGYADLHFLPPEVVERITAQPGSYDPRQGDFAVAGSVRLDLGWREPGVTAKLGAGSFGTSRALVGYRPRGAPRQTFAAFELYSSDGFGPARAARRSAAVAQWVTALGDVARLRVMSSAYVARFSSPGVLRLDDIEAGRVSRTASYDPSQGGDASRVQVVAEIADHGTRDRFSIAPYVVARGMTLHSNFTGYLADRADGDGVVQRNDALTLGVTSSYRVPLGWFSRRDAIEAGVSARHDRVAQSQARVSTLGGAVTRTDVLADVSALDVGGYLDLTVAPIDRVTLRAGARADGLAYRTVDRAMSDVGFTRSTQGSHLGKKATLDVDLGRGTHAVAAYGEGFRSPQARGLANAETTPFTQVVSREVGLRYRDREIAATLAAFSSNLSEDLVFDQSTARNETVPATRRVGGAVDVVAGVASGLTSATSVTYTRAEFAASDARYAQGDLLPYVPQWVVRTDLALTRELFRPAGRALDGRLGAGSTFLGSRPLPYAERGHDVWLVDATAGLRWREVELMLDVFNVADARWFDSELSYASNFQQGALPSLVPARHVTVGAPRTWLCSLVLHL